MILKAVRKDFDEKLGTGSGSIKPRKIIIFTLANIRGKTGNRTHGLWKEHVQYGITKISSVVNVYFL